jgi:hypothetical protein
MAGIKPTSYIDEVALAHDYNYLVAKGSCAKMSAADSAAIELALNKSPYDVQARIMVIGLQLRKLLHLKEEEEIVVDPRLISNRVRALISHKEILDSLLDSGNYN